MDFGEGKRNISPNNMMEGSMHKHAYRANKTLYMDKGY